MRPLKSRGLLLIMRPTRLSLRPGSARS